MPVSITNVKIVGKQKAMFSLTISTTQLQIVQNTRKEVKQMHNAIGAALELIVCSSPFILLFGVAGIAAGIIEHRDKKRELEQAKRNRHKHDAESLETTRKIKMAYYDTLL